MTSLLPSGVLPRLGSLHASTTSTPSKGAAIRSGGGLLSPLTRFARGPIDALGILVQDFRNYLPQDSNSLKEIEERKCLLRLSLHSASTLAEWQAAATELDHLEGNDPWKIQDESTEYDYELVKARLDQLEDARISCDASRMLFLIRTSLSRHIGGMGNLRLYKHTHIGTKRLIERYINVALDTLNCMLDISRKPNSGVDSRVLLNQIVAARQSFGRSALLLSGGGTFGMIHIGVVKCLWETRLLPRIVSGASAGSIVCAVLCTRLDDEIPDILEQFCYGDLEVFTKTGEDDSALTQVARFLKTGALFDIANLTRVMKNLLGDMTFQEAYNRTRRILNICVSSAGVFELPRLLNYVTAPNVIIWSAVAASCSVPVIFSPADILAKDPRTGGAVHWNPSPQRWIDGSVDNDLPMARLSEMFNVNHFIVSQVNPHVTPFLSKEEENGPWDGRDSQGAFDTGAGWFQTLANLAKDEALHRMGVLSELGVFPNLLSKTQSILRQRYSGDITIVPEVSLAQLPRVLQNPNTEFMLQATRTGERATWPKLSRIQNHCAIELALDDAVQAIRARIVFSPSQVDLRLNVMRRPNSRAHSDGGRSDHGERKTLRFLDESGRQVLSKPAHHQSSPGPSLDLSKIVTEPAFVKSRTRKTKPTSENPGGPGNSPDSPPIFSTASDGDDDDSESSTATTTPDSAHYQSSDEDHDYFARSTEVDKNRRLFPHFSQPTTPLHSGRRYLGSSSPVLTSAITPLSTFSAAASQPYRHTSSNDQTLIRSRSARNSSASLAADGDIFSKGSRSSRRDVGTNADAITEYHAALENRLKSLRATHGPASGQ